MYNNRLYYIVNSSDEEDVIWQSIRNIVAQSAEPEFGVTSDSKLEEESIKDLVGDRFDVRIFLWRNWKI